MLDREQISKLAETVVHRIVAGIDLARVLTEAATDSEGREALRVTLVLTPEAIRKLNGDQTLDVLVGIQRALRREGEDRFPIVEYATEQELAAEDADVVADEE